MTFPWIYSLETIILLSYFLVYSLQGYYLRNANKRSSTKIFNLISESKYIFINPG